LLGLWIRRYFVWVTRIPWRAVEASGVPANALTTLAALLALASGVAFAAGHFALGGWLYIFSGILDVFDGRLARAQQRAGPMGAVLDSVLDRYGDAAVLTG
jgi:phosphatidylglycerophosphate synthase